MTFLGKAIALNFLAVLLLPNPQPSLEGCLNSDDLASDLKTITDKDWANLDEKGVERLRPQELGGMECYNGACTSIGRRDRVISDGCQCCTMFMFNLTQNENGTVKHQSLQVVSVYYSTQEKSQLQRSAASLAKAMGVPDKFVRQLKFGDKQSFTWPIEAGEGKPLQMLDAHLFQQQGGWTAFLSLSRYSFKP
jgi:hypothetical protein